MKVLGIYFTLILSLVACGEQKATTSATTGVDSNVIAQESYMLVNYTVPDPMAFGGVATISYNGKSYLIGQQTSQDILTVLQNYSQGEYQLKVQGTFAQETGRFPNPTVTFDVINITKIIE